MEIIFTFDEMAQCLKWERVNLHMDIVRKAVVGIVINSNSMIWIVENNKDGKTRNRIC